MLENKQEKILRVTAERLTQEGNHFPEHSSMRYEQIRTGHVSFMPLATKSETLQVMSGLTDKAKTVIMRADIVEAEKITKQITNRTNEKTTEPQKVNVAEKADVSIKTIEKIVALNCDQDIRRDTARRIEDAVFGDPCDIVCYLEIANSVPEASERLNTAMIDLERALSDNEDIRKAMDNVQITHAAEMQAIRDRLSAGAELAPSARQR